MRTARLLLLLQHSSSVAGRLKSRDLIAAAFSVSELPEGSADPVEIAARIEDGKPISHRHRVHSRSCSYLQGTEGHRREVPQPRA